jgi:hypothetical protein
MIKYKLIKGKEDPLKYIKSNRVVKLKDMKTIIQKDLSLPNIQKVLKL